MEYKRLGGVFYASMWGARGMVAKDEVREESKCQSMKCPSVSGEEFVLHTSRKVGSHWRTLIRGETAPLGLDF